jgi:hypothetical protein
MGFRECINSARDQGVIDRAEADDLIRRFAEHERAHGGNTAAARAGLEAELRGEASRKRRIALLQDAAQERIAGDLQAFRTASGQADIGEAAINVLENVTRAGYSSMKTRQEAILGDAMGRMEAVLYTLRRNLPGMNGDRQARLSAVVDAAFGNGGGHEASALYRSFADVAERLREMYNEAGGDIAKLENWGLPQKHDSAAILKAGRESWTAFVRSRVDPARMTDPRTGTPMTAERLDEALPAVWENIVTDGWSTREPSRQPFGKGALANQRQEHRFLVFKDAAAWREYQAAFGEGDVLAAMMDHVAGMARDIGAMQVMGPNPRATLEWMKQAVAQQRGLAIAGRDSLYGEQNPVRNFMLSSGYDNALDRTYQELAGGGPTGSRLGASMMSATRNWIIGAVQGSTVLTAAVTDPFMMMKARFMAGLPLRGAITDTLSQFSTMNAREITRAGILNEDYMHALRSGAREAGLLAGPEKSRIIPDVVLRASGLSAWTNAGKRGAAQGFMADVADHQGRTWDEVQATRLGDWLRGFGLNAEDWAKLRSVQPFSPHGDSAGLLRPADVEAAHGRDLALRYSEAVHAFVEESVLTGSARMRGALKAGTTSGTITGELNRSFTMFMSYPLTAMHQIMQWTSYEVSRGGKMAGAAAAGTLLIGLSLGGAAAIQLGHLAAGRDFEDMADPDFWIRAMMRGGGLGIWGDYLLADVHKFGRNPAEKVAGPVVGFLGDTLKIASPRAFLGGDETNRGRELTRWIGKYTPGQSLWYMRAAYSRVVVDQLQYLLDPEAHRNMRERERRLQNETGQAFWWKPGQLAPSRAPTVGISP